MLTIRLTRKGKKNQPFFRVVVIDKRRSSKGGRAVEDLGFKNPLTKKVSINKERALYWLKNGAQPSETVHNLFVSEKIIEGEKINLFKISKKKKAEIAITEKAKAEELKAKAEAEKAEKEKPAEPVVEEPKLEIPAESPAEPAVETPKEEPAPEEQPSPVEIKKDAKPEENSPAK